MESSRHWSSLRISSLLMSMLLWLSIPPHVLIPSRASLFLTLCFTFLLIIAVVDFIAVHYFFVIEIRSITPFTT